MARGIAKQATSRAWELTKGENRRTRKEGTKAFEWKSRRKMQYGSGPRLVDNEAYVGTQVVDGEVAMMGGRTKEK